MCDAPEKRPDGTGEAGARAQAIAPAALGWYDRSRRDLPWRAPPGALADPYVVWLSEIMLQQTTVAAVRPYFAAFLARWPTVEALAAAPDAEILAAWAGLGYYSRARNLIACARRVAHELGGRFPDTEEGLRALPGLGPYTAAAVASIAFGRRAVVVDGNVERVLSRVFAVAAPLPAARAGLRRLAGAATPATRPGDYAQAMMDLGATICVPRRPACVVCPLSAPCAARAEGDPARYPARAKKPERPLRRGAAFYVTRPDGAVLLRQRPPKGLLGGMAEIPCAPWSVEFDEAEAARFAPLDARFQRVAAEVEHVFTHFVLRLSIYWAEVEMERAAPQGCRWAPARLEGEALPSVMRKAIAAARREAAATLRHTA
ncbi:A/G-specific adenine glycosylase [Methylocella sp.]|uniref:A/G-specific adenine glycosylase n=1 Tax=Methylocella sp. TaxID=1978226 RepID=UPI0037848E55